MQTVNTAALDQIAARILGVSPEVMPFTMFSWDSRDAVEEPTYVGKRVRLTDEPIEGKKKLCGDAAPHPIFKVGKLPAEKVNELREKDKAERLEALKAAYASSGDFEVEVPDYTSFACEIAKAYRNHTNGQIPTFLLDEDTIFQVENEGAELLNLGDLL